MAKLRKVTPLNAESVEIDRHEPIFPSVHFREQDLIKWQ